METSGLRSLLASASRRKLLINKAMLLSFQIRTRLARKLLSTPQNYFPFDQGITQGAFGFRGFRNLAPEPLIEAVR